MRCLLFSLVVMNINLCFSQDLNAKIGKERNVYIIHYGLKPLFHYDTIKNIKAKPIFDKAWRFSRMIDFMLNKTERKSINGDAIFLPQKIWKLLW